jgi:hypothetical protein
MKLRHIFLWLTGAFWLGMAYYAVRCEHPSANVGRQLAVGHRAVVVPVHLPVLSVADVASHHLANDCWITMNGVVYDLSAYLPEHPGKKREIETVCGKDGTESWDAKQSGREKGQPHSIKAFQLLAEYPPVGIVK